jgi:cell shape-determining protein MreC
MKGYRSHNSTNVRQQRIIRVLVGIVLVCVVAWLTPTIVSRVTDVLLWPVHGLRNWVLYSPSPLPLWIQDRDALITHIAELEQALLEERGHSLTMSRLLEENRQFRTLLGASSTERIVAGVVARPPTLPYDLLQIDRGRTNGVVVGSPVFVGRDAVVGVVTQIHDSHAFVEPFSSPQFQTTVYITGADIVATLEGVGGGVARVRVPQGVLLQPGQSVHVLGLEPGIYGEIAYLEQEPTQPEQYGYIPMPYALTTLRYVSVGTNPVRRPDVADVEAVRRAETSPLFAPELVVPTSTATSTATGTDAVELIDDVSTVIE